MVTPPTTAGPRARRRPRSAARRRPLGSERADRHVGAFDVDDARGRDSSLAAEPEHVAARSEDCRRAPEVAAGCLHVGRVGEQVGSLDWLEAERCPAVDLGVERVAVSAGKRAQPEITVASPPAARHCRAIVPTPEPPDPSSQIQPRTKVPRRRLPCCRRARDRAIANRIARFDRGSGQ